MLGALTPLGKVAQAKRRWLSSVVSFTVSGALTSVAVGLLLGRTGELADFHLTTLPIAVALAAFGLLAAGRELMRLPIPLPQMRRATRDRWARRWGHTRASVLWGADIGAFFTTWLTFLGAWWLVALAISSGDPGFAGELFGAYWAARAATVWIGPLLVPNATITPRLVVAWHQLYRPFQLAHGITVLLGVVVVIALAM